MTFIDDLCPHLRPPALRSIPILNYCVWNEAKTIVSKRWKVKGQGGLNSREQPTYDEDKLRINCLLSRRVVVSLVCLAVALCLGVACFVWCCFVFV
jgi:hypothetical protein